MMKLKQLLTLRNDVLQNELYLFLVFLVLFVFVVEAVENGVLLLDPAGNQAGGLHFLC